MKSFRIAVLGLALAGCAFWLPYGSPSAELLARADRLSVEGDYTSALQTYEEFLRRYPDAGARRRAQVSRDAVANSLAARVELARLRRDLAARDVELGRLRHELAARQSEVTRLREDLEELKRTDMRLERRRP